MNRLLSIRHRISSIQTKSFLRCFSSNSKHPDNQDSGYDLFEQLKAQQSYKDPDADLKERERIRRQQESAEKEINERQAKTFGAGSIMMLAGVIGLYAYMGIFIHK